MATAVELHEALDATQDAAVSMATTPYPPKCLCPLVVFRCSNRSVNYVWSNDFAAWPWLGDRFVLNFKSITNGPTRDNSYRTRTKNALLVSRQRLFLDFLQECVSRSVDANT